MRNNNHLVILAGGVGSRIWPLSNEECPKQFRDVLNCGLTLLQMTYNHFAGMFEAENIWVVTSKQYVDFVSQQLPDVRPENILREPESRNTASSIAYVSWKIKSINSRANIVVTPSDHLINDLKVFRATISECMDFTAETDAIIMLGIRPTRPETGYGYIEADLSFASSRNSSIYRVDHFIEKPTPEAAQNYIQSKGMFWNSGIFIWSVSTIVNAYRVYQPDMARFFESLMPVYGTSEEQRIIDERYGKLEDVSVDYAIMEKVEEIFVYAATFGWRDLGSWSALHDELNKDVHDNVTVGAVSTFDTNHCIIHAPSLKRVVVQGLDGYIVAENNGVLLICKQSDEQRIKLFQ